MKNFAFLLVALGLSVQVAVAQDKWSGNLGLGLGFPFTDLTESTYPGYRPNLAVTAGLGYQLWDNFRLRGDVLSGFLNGNDETSYYQAQIFEGNIAAEYNLISLIDDNTNFKVNLLLGGGLGLLNSERYNILTRRRITEVPSNPGNLYSYQVHGGWIWTPFGIMSEEHWKLQGTMVDVKYHSEISPFALFHPKWIH